MKSNSKSGIVKKKKHAFSRQQTSYKKFRDPKWRYPRGKSSKVRTKRSGHKVPPSIGFGNKVEHKHLNTYGLLEFTVSTESQLHNLHPKKHAIVLSSTLGERKRILILEKVKAKGFTVMNVKDIDAYIKNVHEQVKKRKEDKKKRQSKKVQEKTPEKPKEKKEETKQELTSEEKEVKEKEFQRKVLEKRE